MEIYRSNVDDQISKLPKDIILHILSFLPTKYAIRTTVLSPIWYKLFTYVPVLDFNYDDDNHDFIDIPTFINFVNYVFILNNIRNLNKFSLHFRNKYSKYGGQLPIALWVSGAIQRNVKKINIYIADNSSKYYILPHDILKCKNLVNLSLVGFLNIVLLPNSEVCLPCLKTCHLENVTFDDQSAQRLFRSCPVLEYLDISRCIIKKNVEVFDVSVSTLKHLTLYDNGCMYNIVLNVPNLVYFGYTGFALNKFLGLESLKSVVDATICYTFRWGWGDKDNIIEELVRSLCHVRHLYLSGPVMEVFLHSGHSWPTFNNLTRLECCCSSILPSRLIPGLLDYTPRLEFLSLYQRYKDSYRGGAGESSYLLPEHVPECVSLHLKEIEFRDFTGLSCECELVNYFLEHAKNLKKLKIRPKLDWNEQFETSPAACQIVVE